MFVRNLRWLVVRVWALDLSKFESADRGVVKMLILLKG